MMKDGKRIVIRSGFLKKLRNSLRSIIINAIYDERSMLDTFIQLFENRPYFELSHEEKGDRRKLMELYNNLQDNLLFSICECMSCTRSNRDMVYIEEVNGWCCTECYDSDRYFVPSKIYTSPKYNYVTWYNQQKEKYKSLFNKK